MPVKNSHLQLRKTQKCRPHAGAVFAVALRRLECLLTVPGSVLLRQVQLRPGNFPPRETKQIGARRSRHSSVVVHGKTKLCNVRLEWLKKSCALKVEKRKLKVRSEERDTSSARKLLAQRSKLVALDVTLKQRQFLLQDPILILLIRVGGDIVKPIVRGGSRGVHDG